MPLAQPLPQAGPAAHVAPSADCVARIDHLVVVAASLDEGVRWCESTLGVTPGPGGDHPLMGTHNRLMRIATVNFPRAYFEIIAINTIASEVDFSRAKRWFDMDSSDLREAVAASGPRLVHLVAGVPDAHTAVRDLAALGIDRGEVIEASRMTPSGLLEWKITVRPDGARLFGGCLPTLIEWGDRHPAGDMPESGVTLESLVVTHPDATVLGDAYGSIGLTRVTIRPGEAPNLIATLRTPRGIVVLESKGL